MGGGGAPAGASAGLAGLRILVVDDEEDARNLVGKLLGDRGAQVDVAPSAADAVRLLKASRYDVVVSDIGMPQEDGYSLLRRLRAMAVDEGGETPALALTAYAAPEDRQRALGSGFQVHLAKPVEPSALLAAVAGLAGRR